MRDNQVVVSMFGNICVDRGLLLKCCGMKEGPADSTTEVSLHGHCTGLTPALTFIHPLSYLAEPTYVRLKPLLILE